MKDAIALYEECLDMDFRDHKETMEADIGFLNQMISTFGFDKTRALLVEAEYIAE